MKGGKIWREKFQTYYDGLWDLLAYESSERIVENNYILFMYMYMCSAIVITQTAAAADAVYVTLVELGRKNLRSIKIFNMHKLFDW